MEKKTLDNHALPNHIKKSIIDEIMQGKIKSGDKLVEAKYSDMFGTSRAPVREVFYLLNAYPRLASPLMSLQTIAFMKDEAIRISLKEHKQIVALLAEERFEEAKVLLNSHNQAVYPRVREMKGI